MSELVAALESSSRGWAGKTPMGAQLRSTRAFIAAAESDPSLLREAAANLRAQEPGAAAWIAVTFGTMVERGADPRLTGPAVIELLRQWLADLPSGSGEDEPPPPDAAQTALLDSFRFVCQAAVAHLARLSALRAELGQDAALLDRLAFLQGYSPGAFWVREALLKASGTVVLLHPSTRTGVRVRYTNVSNCFHLFSLIQTAVGTRLAGGREPNDAVAQVARGKSSDPVGDEAWWHYGNARSTKADIMTSIWGEGLVREIAAVDGAQVILAWPMILKSRTWDAGFLGPHLEAMPADAVLDGVLSQAECDTWFERLGLVAADAPRKWWRVW